MQVFFSVPSLLVLRSADASLELTVPEPVMLPALEAGSTVSVFFRFWGGYANYEWFVAVRDPSSRELLLAHHAGDLSLFDEGLFQSVLKGRRSEIDVFTYELDFGVFPMGRRPALC